MTTQILQHLRRAKSVLKRNTRTLISSLFTHPSSLSLIAEGTASYLSRKELQD